MNEKIIEVFKLVIEKQLNNLNKFFQEEKDFLIGYNEDKYEKIDLEKKELIIDENTYNTNYKKNKSFLYQENIYYLSVFIGKGNVDDVKLNIDFSKIEKESLDKYRKVIFINEQYYKNDSKNFTIINKKYYHLTMKPNKIITNQKLFELKLRELEITKERPSLLLHSCCGPCSSYVLEYLYKYFDITILYYNPNINSIVEFNKRLDYQKKIIASLGYDIKIIVPEYNHNNYLEYIKGLEKCREGENRCYKCYEERMLYLAKLADKKYDFFTTTISVSPYKNSLWINEIGLRIQDNYDTKYLYANFKLHDGYKKSIELSKKYNLYRQDYCGCEFSYEEMKNTK